MGGWVGECARARVCACACVWEREHERDSAAPKASELSSDAARVKQRSISSPDDLPSRITETSTMRKKLEHARNKKKQPITETKETNAHTYK